RLSLELVFAPYGIGREHRVRGPFDHDLEPFFGDRAERAVGPDDVEGIEARVHDLPPREQVSSWAVTEEHDERGDCENDREIPARTALRPVRGQREDAPERRVIEGRDRERDGDKVQPGEI